MDTLLRCAWCVLAWVTPAGAQDAIPTTLEWSAPPECIDASALRARMDAELGRRAFVDRGDAELVLVGTVEPYDERYRARLELRGAHGATYGLRTIESDTGDCRALDDVLDLVLRLMLEVRRDQLDLGRPRARAPWAGGVSASAAVVLGLLPGPALETAIAFSLEPPAPIVIAIELAYDWSDTASAPPGFLHAQAASVRLMGGPVLRADPIELAFLVAVEAGAIWARAAGFDENLTATDAFFAVRGGLRFAIRVVGPLYVYVRAEGGFTPARPVFRARDADGTVRPLFEPLAGLGSFGGGLGLRFE